MAASLLGKTVPIAPPDGSGQQATHPAVEMAADALRREHLVSETLRESDGIFGIVIPPAESSARHVDLKRVGFRASGGSISNCALANGDFEETCQVCLGTCPDRSGFQLAPEEDGTRVPSKESATPGEIPPPRNDVANSGKAHEVRDEGTNAVPVGPAAAFDTKSGSPERRAFFTTANGKVPGISPDVARIVETYSQVDARAEYDALEAALEVGEERSDYMTLRRTLDGCERFARRAHKLYISVKLELAGWEVDSRRTMTALREEARAALEAEKESGVRKKAIFKEDLADWIADEHPDEYRAQEMTRARLKAVVEDMEHLVRRWDARCVDVRTLLETLRK